MFDQKTEELSPSVPHWLLYGFVDQCRIFWLFVLQSNRSLGARQKRCVFRERPFWSGSGGFWACVFLGTMAVLHFVVALVFVYISEGWEGGALPLFEMAVGT